MENHPDYLTNTVTIPGHCLRPFKDGWKPPTPEELRAACNQAGLNSGGQIGELVGTNPRTVRKWLGGNEKIPYSAWAVICLEANLGQIWIKTTRNEQL